MSTWGDSSVSWDSSLTTWTGGATGPAGTWGGSVTWGSSLTWTGEANPAGNSAIGVGATSAVVTVKHRGAGATGVGWTAAAPSAPWWPPPDGFLVGLDSTAAVLGGGIVWLYGLQESSGSTVAGDVSGANGRPLLSLSAATEVGTAEFGASGIMPEGTAISFQPAIPDGEVDPTGRALTGSSVTAYLGGDFTVFCAFAWTGSTGATLLTLGAAAEFALSVTPTAVTATITSDVTSRSTAVAVATNDNRPHFAVVSLVNGTMWLHVDDEDPDTQVYAAGIVGTTVGMTIGDNTTVDPHQVAWVGYSNASMTPAAAADLANLGSGGSERSDERVARICRWLGVGVDLVAEEGLSDVAYQATGGAQALDVIRTTNQVEDGVFFTDGGGLLRFHSRGHRYDPPVRLQLDATDISPDTAVQVDLTKVVNDLTVSRPAGATYRARSQDSITAYGERSQQDTIYAASDPDLQSAAGWRVHRYGTPAPRIPSITLNLLPMTAAQANSVLSLEIGDRIQVVNMPATTPGGTTVDLMVEGMDEQVGAAVWTVTLSTSPYWPLAAAYLDTSELDDTVLAY